MLLDDTLYSAHSYRNCGILIYPVDTSESGLRLGGGILNKAVDKTTVLFLSGGKTPKELYRHIAKEGKLHPGAVGLVDERFGVPMHENSNERMLQEAGFLRYCKSAKIPVCLFLRKKLSREETATRYDEQVRTLFSTYRKHIAVLGIGLDGHTAGLPAKSSKFKIQNSKLYTTNDFVTQYNDASGKYGERVTMTYMALSMMDLLLVLVFGKEKQHALDLLFSDGSEEEVPARFFKRPEIAKKTILITDQVV